MKHLPDQQAFIEHLSSLAQEGETLLLARQKPTGSQVYKDGTQRYTWPPMLPTKKVGEDWAIYANTGAFIMDRMGERLSASSANCDFVLAMVLDDVGTKSKAPPLAPTWKMETSKGNYQWGYIFSDQPDTKHFTAAIKAIAGAGYTDGGAINAVRNFRIPGSVNLKGGKGKFVSRLTEWRPDREFTLEQICKALGVVPGDAVDTTYKGLTIKRDNDEVLNWLSDQGLVISGMNHDGWCQVVCPNHGTHSDPNDLVAKYKPSDRGFCCYHEHCGDWGSAEFLAWVKENGGPDVCHGVSDDEAASRFAKAMSKVKPPKTSITPTFEAIKAVKEEQEVVRLDIEAQRADMFHRYLYVEDGDLYYDTYRRVPLPRTVFNAVNRHIPCTSTLFEKPRRIEPSVWFDENREACGGTAVRAITYAPGEDSVVEIVGVRYANTWVNHRGEVDIKKKVDVSMWLNHCDLILGEDEEGYELREHILDVMACKVQNPKVKINHAILICGVERTGKDTMFKPFLHAVGGLQDQPANCSVVDAKDGTVWTDHLECEVLVLNELMEPTSAERRALANSLKPVIAAPPDMLSINKKFLPKYNIVNRLLVIAFSNERAPISLSTHDQRWLVKWSDAVRMPSEYYNNLYAWFRNGGLEACATWLHQRDVSKFNPKAPPVSTRSKELVIEDGRNLGELWVVEQAQALGGEFAGGMIISSFINMADRLQGIAPTHVKVFPKTIIDAVASIGWVFLKDIHSRKYRTRKQIWISPEVQKMLELNLISRTEIRDMAEEGRSPLTEGI